MLKAWLERRWYASTPPPLALRPLAALYGRIARRRRAQSSARAAPLPVPVIVVGNISVGGTGKTPFVIWLVEQLREWGYKPGVVSRGYGGHAPEYPLRVTPLTDPALCGDEPALIARRLRCPLAVAPDRVAAARLLLDKDEADILVSDDGLQHYALHRDFEFCVVDGARGLGNGALLPAGPLREPAARLDEVGLIVANGGGFAHASKGVIDMHLVLREARALRGNLRQPLSGFAGQTVHAVAGIGHPRRFFDQLRQLGIELIEHPFADHHRFVAADLRFGDALAVLMTEKDAVKCDAIADARCWSVPVDALIDPRQTALVRQSLPLRKSGS